MQRTSCSSSLSALALALAVTSALTVLPCDAHAQSDPRVRTSAGELIGVTNGPVARFMGIPYAEPPLAEQRFKAPGPAPAWSTPRRADTAGSDCPQLPMVGGQDVASATGSEDCLYLNVYTPAGDASKRKPMPVMVWIHGGGLTSGSARQYDPEGLAARGVVVVTINYRLGLLGFLTHPALRDEQGASGNYGLMDQRAALAWVRDHIGAFGGDPSNVTIFGESAGGLSVLSHLTSRQSAGLFARAVIMSGAYALDLKTRAEAEPIGVAIARKLGCEDAECLRKLPVASLLGAVDRSSAGLEPTVDGAMLTKSPRQALEQGLLARVPVLHGTTRNEGSLFVAFMGLISQQPLTAETYAPAVAWQARDLLKVPDASVAQILAAYPVAAYATPQEALAAVITDGSFACNARAASRLLARHTPTYVYEFDDPKAPALPVLSTGFALGSYHTSDLQFLMGGGLFGPLPPLAGNQLALSDTMVSYWTHFAARGVPSGPATPAWPPSTARSDDFQRLTPTGSHHARGFAEEHKCALWDALHADKREQTKGTRASGPRTARKVANR